MKHHVLPSRPCGPNAARHKPSVTLLLRCHSCAAPLGLPAGHLGRCQAELCSVALIPLRSSACLWPSPALERQPCMGGEPRQTPRVPTGGGGCAWPPDPLPLGGDARAFVPVTPPGSSEWKTAGGSFLALWELPAPGQAPVLTPLLSPQVVSESGARERERHAAQQAGQVRRSPHCCPVLCRARDPRKQQQLLG